MNTNYFQGLDGYVWWHGVVEDRKDPLLIGRCRVRILGWHTENKSDLPTSNLPWAFPLMPLTSASQTGVGQTPVGPVEGTWVLGFYRDGELAQEPVMVGTLPGIPAGFAKQNTGFNDPRLDDSSTNKNSSWFRWTCKDFWCSKKFRFFSLSTQIGHLQTQVKKQKLQISRMMKELHYPQNLFIQEKPKTLRHQFTQEET